MHSDWSISYRLLCRWVNRNFVCLLNYFIIAFSIGNCMNASSFRNLWVGVMFWKFAKLHETKVSAIWELQNITSDHKSRNAQASSYNFLFFIFSTMKQRYFNDYPVVCARTLWIFLSFCSLAHFWQTFNQVCIAFKVLIFVILIFCCSTSLWFDKAKTIVGHFVLFSTLALASAFFSIATSVLHSII